MICEEEFVAYMKQDFPQLKMTREDLANPSKQFAINFYWCMLENITRMNPRQLVKVNDQQGRILQCASATGLPEHIAVINLFKTLKYIFAQMQFQTEFRHSDLIVPFQAPKRSFVFMASLYQFYSHCAVFDEKFETIDRTEEKAQLIAKLQQEQNAMKEKLAYKEERKKQFQDRSKDVKMQLVELSQNNEKLELMLKELQQEKDLQSDKLLTVEKHEQALQDEFEKAQNEKKYHESLVVSDSGDIIESHGNLNRKKSDSFRKLRDLEQQVAEKSAKVNQFDTVLSLYNLLVEALRENVTVCNKSLDVKDLYMGLTSAKKDIQILEKEENDFAANVIKSEEEKACLSADMASLIMECDKKCSGHAEAVTSYKVMLKEIQQKLSHLEHKAQIDEASHRDMVRTLNELINHISHIEKEIKESDSQHMKNYTIWKNRLLQVFREIESKALEYKEDDDEKKHG